MIKHEDVRVSLELMRDDVIDFRDLIKNDIDGSSYSTDEDYNLILNYINEHEKKDELLDLYRECYEEGYFWLEIQQRIKALEEEMK